MFVIIAWLAAGNIESVTGIGRGIAARPVGRGSGDDGSCLLPSDERSPHRRCAWRIHYRCRRWVLSGIVRTAPALIDAGGIRCTTRRRAFGPVVRMPSVIRSPVATSDDLLRLPGARSECVIVLETCEVPGVASISTILCLRRRGSKDIGK